jgi:hypothetical protein
MSDTEGKFENIWNKKDKGGGPGGAHIHAIPALRRLKQED